MKERYTRAGELYQPPVGCVLQGGDHITDRMLQQYVVPQAEDAIAFHLIGFVMNVDTGRFKRITDLNFPIIVEHQL